MRILFVIPAAIEIFAVVLWVVGERTSVRNFIIIVGSLVVLQASLLINSNFRLWKKT